MPQQFTCFMIGEGTLVIQCAKRILEQAHQILGIISPDEAVTHWANRKGIPCIQSTDNLIDFLSQKPFDGMDIYCHRFRYFASPLLPFRDSLSYKPV